MEIKRTCGKNHKKDTIACTSKRKIKKHVFKIVNFKLFGKIYNLL